RAAPDRGRPAHVRGLRRRRARDADRRAHDGGRRAQRRHGRDDGQGRPLSRRGNRPLHRLVHAGVRAAAHGRARPRRGRRGGDHVHAGLRAGREHPVKRLPETALAIPAADLQWAREQAARGAGRLPELLEKRLACGPDEFLARLSATVRIPAITLEDMRAGAPAFDLIPYAEATRRGCVALRPAGEPVWVVLADPCDLDVQDWVEEWLSVPFRYRI